METRELIDERVQRRAAIVKALAHPVRLRIAELLSQGKSMCVADLSSSIGVEITVMSKHLRRLRAVGLVDCDKDGTQRVYRTTCPCLTDFFSCVDSIVAGQASS